MYKHFTKEDWKNFLGFPEDYTVDALIIDGSGKRENELVRSEANNLQIQGYISKYIIRE